MYTTRSRLKKNRTMKKSHLLTRIGTINRNIDARVKFKYIMPWAENAVYTRSRFLRRYTWKHKNNVVSAT